MTRVVPHTTAPHQTCGRTCWHRLALLRLLSPPPPARFQARAVARGFVGVEPEANERGERHYRLKQCAHRSEFVETAMRTLRQIAHLFSAEEPLDEAVEFLTSHQRARAANASRVDTHQTERRGSILVTGKPVPQTHHQRADEFVRLLDCVGSSPPHRSCTTLIGEADMTGEAMLPRNRVCTSWNGTGHL
jgi:hypothetical protein